MKNIKIKIAAIIFLSVFLSDTTKILCSQSINSSQIANQNNEDAIYTVAFNEKVVSDNTNDIRISGSIPVAINTTNMDYFDLNQKIQSEYINMKEELSSINEISSIKVSYEIIEFDEMYSIIIYYDSSKNRYLNTINYDNVTGKFFTVAEILGSKYKEKIKNKVEEEIEENSNFYYSKSNSIAKDDLISSNIPFYVDNNKLFVILDKFDSKEPLYKPVVEIPVVNENKYGSQFDAVYYIKEYDGKMYTMLPLRYSLGDQISITWDEESKSIILNGEGIEASIAIGDTKYTYNGVTENLSIAPEIFSNTTFITDEFFKNVFNADIIIDTDGVIHIEI